MRLTLLSLLLLPALSMAQMCCRKNIGQVTNLGSAINYMTKCNFHKVNPNGNCPGGFNIVDLGSQSNPYIIDQQGTPFTCPQILGKKGATGAMTCIHYQFTKHFGVDYVIPGVINVNQSKATVNKLKVNNKLNKVEDKKLDIKSINLKSRIGR